VFTGIVQGVGRVADVEAIGGDLRLRIDAGPVSLAGVGIGDSIAVNGACLTAVELGGGGFAADVSRETLSLTTLGELAAGSPVNLENALRAGQALGGHYVSGHVDGVGQVLSRRDDARSVRIEFEVPPGLGRYVARKGSICIDGVSLTVNSASGTRFDVNLVPHTLEVTTLGRLAAGTRVNLEVDIIARYLERLLAEGR
jgi:riboflavin synthase